MNNGPKNRLGRSDRPENGKGKTPVRRVKTTRRSVIIADKVADKTITVGGITVILAVLVIVVFLVYQVLPLFSGGKLHGHAKYKIEGNFDHAVEIVMDEQKTFATVLFPDGALMPFHVKTGTPLPAKSLELGGKPITAFAASTDREHIVLGFPGGFVRTGTLGVKAEIIPADSVNLNSLKKIDEQDSSDGSVVYSKVAGNQIRKTSLAAELDDQIQVFDSGSDITALSYKFGGEAERPTKAVIAVSRTGEMKFVHTESTLNLLTNTLQSEVTTHNLPPLPAGVTPSYMLLTDNFDKLLVAEQNGRVFRYDILNPSQARLVETRRLVPEGVKLAFLGELIGGASIVAGGTDGSVSIFFVLERKDAGTADGKMMAPTRKFEPHPSSVTAFDAGQRGKTFVTADDKGDILIQHSTSQKVLFRFHATGKTEKEIRYAGLSLAPRMDGLVALQDNGTVDFWDFAIPHPETSWRTLFGKVWYEGYPEPTFTWQSSAATDAYEPKFSLVPLIFGTLKATVYSLLFAIPIALLGAVYTSEFVHYRIRGVLKPTMELMASLPSVVLGFVAALVLAPVVETWIGAVLLAFVVAPLCLIIAAYLWQLMPLHFIIRYQGYSKFFLMMAVVALGFYLAYLLGPGFEKLFFGGDFRAWVNGDFGSDTPFLFLILLPFSVAVAAYVLSRFFGRRFRAYSRTLGWSRAALMDLIRWLVISGTGMIVSYLAAVGLDAVGFSVRGGFVGTYIQRNTLVVGFAMGFAVIPIIYTIAEDALNAVPEHLRAASLGCGATPWQTAIWVILPTALSGVFSAVMIGMGRAVGETMIVVMAAGNTPIIDWNIFNGLRALSANIAVELPEAVKGGTLYRTLFLCGMVLFAATFVINTVAEIVRQRFRKRAMQL